jgi:hypothetical protein
VHITVVLTDGCVVRGVRMSINPQITEDGNRDMVLYPPIFQKRPDESELTRTSQDIVVISASKVSYFTTKVWTVQDPYPANDAAA